MDPEDYGPLLLHPITEGRDFVALYKALQSDESGFVHNLDVIAQAFHDDNLFGLTAHETDAMFARGAHNDPFFDSWCSNYHTLYLLPCFAVVNDDHDTCIIIWVHSKYRRLGLGTALVDQLDIRRVINPLPESRHFWAACEVLDENIDTFFEGEQSCYSSFLRPCLFDKGADEDAATCGRRGASRMKLSQECTGMSRMKPPGNQAGGGAA